MFKSHVVQNGLKLCKDDLELLIRLPLLPQWWDYRPVAPRPIYLLLGMDLKALACLESTAPPELHPRHYFTFESEGLKDSPTKTTAGHWILEVCLHTIGLGDARETCWVYF